MPSSTRAPGRLGEGGQLAHGVLGVVVRALRVHADEHDVLEPQLPVLDLGDVFELGREPCDTTQRRALLTVELLAVGGSPATSCEPSVMERVGGARRRTGSRPALRLRAAQHPLDGVVCGGAVRLRSSCQPYFAFVVR